MVRNHSRCITIVDDSTGTDAVDRELSETQSRHFKQRQTQNMKYQFKCMIYLIYFYFFTDETAVSDKDLKLYPSMLSPKPLDSIGKTNNLTEHRGCKANAASIG